MIKISKMGLMLGVTLLTMNVQAGIVDFTLDVKKDQSKTVTINLDKMDKVDLSIYDADGTMIHTEKVNSEKNLSKTYDLKALPEGVYFLEAESDTKITRYEISVAHEKATLSTKAISELYKPAFINKEGLVRLSFLNMDKSPVNIRVYDKESNAVYESEAILDQNVSKVFNIKEINDQEYTFVMTYKDKSYSKTFASK